MPAQCKQCRFPGGKGEMKKAGLELRWEARPLSENLMIGQTSGGRGGGGIESCEMKQ